jgi:hypothetical protein
LHWSAQLRAACECALRGVRAVLDRALLP